MHRRAGLVLTLSLVAGCGADNPAIERVHGSADSVTLEVTTDTCNAHPMASVEESARQVRISLTANRSWGDDDCADSVLVTLTAPLGTRAVIDSATDRRLEVLPPG